MKDKKNLMCKAAIVSCGYGIFSDSVIVPVITGIYEEFPSASMFLKNYVLTGGYLFSLFASLAAGILMKKISKRKLMLFGSICFFIGGFGAVFTSSMEYLALMRTLDGLSDGILAATALSLITELYKDERERASMIGLYTGVSAAFGFAFSF